MILYNMSFNSTIFGAVTSAPALIYNSTNVSTDNISNTNLSGSIATFDEVTTTTLNISAFEASYLNLSNLSVSNDVTIGNNLSVAEHANVSNISVKGYGYIRWDLNVSNTVYAQANFEAGNSIFANANGDFGGYVTLNEINFRRTPADGGLTMSNITANASSLDMWLKYDWNVYKNTTSGTKIMSVEFGPGRVNISNLSTTNISATDMNVDHDMNVGGTLEVTDIDFLASSNGATRAMLSTTTNNLSIGSVADIIFENLTNTSPFMTMDVSQHNVNISNLSLDNLSTNLLQNISAGENISLTIEAGTNKLVITGQGGLNSSNLSLDNLSVSASLTASVAQIGELKNCDMTNSLKGGSDVDYPFADNLSVGFDVSSIDTTIMMNPNISMYGIELLPDLYLNPPTFVMNLGRAELTAMNVSNLSVQTEFTAPLAEITHLTIASGGTFNHDLINSLAVGANMSIVSVNNKPRIGVKHNINLSNVSVEGAVHITERMAVGGVDFKHTGTNNLISYLDVNSPSMKWFLKKTMDFRKDDNNGIVFMKLNHTVGNVNISNLSTENTSVTNLSVLESITAGTGGVGGGIYAKNGTGVFSTGGFYFNNSADGTGGNLNIFWTGGNISAYGIGTLDGHDVRLANGYNTGGLVVDGTINNINMSNCSITNLSVNVVQSSLTNASVINTEFLNVSGSAPFFGDGLTVYGSTTTQNISTSNISSSGFITTAGDIRSSGGFRAIGGSGIISTGPIHFNNANNGLGDSLEIYYTGTEFGMGTVSGKDFRINAGYNTGGLVVDGTINNINMSNCSITNLSLDTLTCDLTSNLTAGSNITITSVGGKPVIASSGGSLPANASFDNVSISNKLTVVDSIGCQTLGADGNIQTSNSFTIRKDAFTALTQTINGNEFRISTTSSNQDIRICNATGAGGLLFDAGLNNISIDNLSVANLSLTNLTTDLTSNLTAGTNITITSVGGKPVISASGGGGGVTDPLNLSQLNASNISVDNISSTTFSTTQIRLKDPADPTVTKGSIFCNPNAFQYYGPSQVFFNNTVSPNVEYMRMDSSKSNVNISNLSSTNTSILNDATITRDLQVQRYLDRGKPRFIMLYRTSGLALTGSNSRGAIFTSNTTGQVGGEFGIANGSDISVTTGGWYRVSFALGFLRTSGNRITVRPYTRTKPSGGSFTFSSSKDIFGASCYMRSASLNREGYTTGTVLRYIPAGGSVQITIDCMVEGSGTFSSSFNGTNLRNQSNFMVEFVSSASET